jgi:hypothetical protein
MNIYVSSALFVNDTLIFIIKFAAFLKILAIVYHFACVKLAGHFD